MTDTEQTQAPRQQLATMRTGGQVAAIVPQSIAEVWQVAKGVVAAGLAPKSLGKPDKDDVVSAVAITIMAGAELGLKPMVSLRSFTVINGKPALYGDGLINVVRGSGKVKKLRTGCDVREGKMVGWCEAARLDTGEESRVEFSEDDAIRAGLWSPDDRIRKEVWENGKKVWKDNQANDSPWHRFPQRMLAWRAAGYCLRELFGDVLGGIRDEFEEREIAEATFEEAPAHQQAARNQPPAPPPEEDATDIEPFDAAEFTTNIIAMCGNAPDETSLIAEWERLRVDDLLADHTQLLDEAYEARMTRLGSFEEQPEPDGFEEQERERGMLEDRERG